MPAANRRLVPFAFAVVYLVWGSTYLAIRIAVETLPPFLLAGARHLVGGLILLAWARTRTSERITRAHLKTAAIIGILMLTLGNGLVVWAEQEIGSGQAALLVTSSPIWVILFVMLRDRTTPTKLTMAGVLVGFAGQFLLVSPGSVGSGNLLGAAGCLVATVAWALASTLSPRLEHPAFKPLGVALQMLVGGLVLLGFGGTIGEVGRTDWHAVSLRSVAAWAYLVVFGSVLAFTCYMWLLGMVDPILASTNTYINPIVAVVLGWLVLSEPITGRMIVAGVIALAGVVLLSLGMRAPPIPVVTEPLEELA